MNVSTITKTPSASAATSAATAAAAAAASSSATATPDTVANPANTLNQAAPKGPTITLAANVAVGVMFLSNVTAHSGR